MIENIDQQPVPLSQILARLTHKEQIHVIMTHPFFTGQCPQCHSKIQLAKTSLGNCHCANCGWLDQVV